MSQENGEGAEDLDEDPSTSSSRSKGIGPSSGSNVSDNSCSDVSCATTTTTANPSSPTTSSNGPSDSTNLVQVGLGSDINDRSTIKSIEQNDDLSTNSSQVDRNVAPPSRVLGLGSSSDHNDGLGDRLGTRQSEAWYKRPTESEDSCGSSSTRSKSCLDEAIEKVKKLPSLGRSNRKAFTPLATKDYLLSERDISASTNILDLLRRNSARDPKKTDTGTDTSAFKTLYSNAGFSTPDLKASATKNSPTLKHQFISSPYPSLSQLDTNNNDGNKDKSLKETTRKGFFDLKRSNFSKSASGNRLISGINRSDPCDDTERRHNSSRRQFIEHYYNIRTQLPSSSSSTSSSNIITPLNRLNECDAITTRLLSSPTRLRNQCDSQTPTPHGFTDADRSSRRASLGTSSMTDQMFSFSSVAFKSLELGIGSTNSSLRCDVGDASSVIDPQARDSSSQQQQNRSLSMCDDDNPKSRTTSSSHTPSLSRAISLASDPRGPLARQVLSIIPLFGCDIESLNQCLRFGSILPPIIDSTICHIKLNGINSVGIFRKSGVKSRILALRQRIESNQNVKFSELDPSNEFSIYDVADLVKMWFRELKPVPLVTKELIRLVSVHIDSSVTSPTTELSTSMKCTGPVKPGLMSFGSRSLMPMAQSSDCNIESRINSVITETHRALLSKALDFLAEISSKSEVNQMTSQNLAICLTPSLCATETNQKSVLMAQRVLEYCIDNRVMLFE